MTNPKIKRIHRIEMTFGDDGVPVAELLRALIDIPESSRQNARLKVVSHYNGDQREPSYTEMRIDWEMP